MTAAIEAAVGDCSACDGSGEITVCVNDGTHGCSHVHDYSYVCQDCGGTGEVPTDPGVASPEEAPAGRTCPPAPSGGASPWRALAPVDGAGSWRPTARHDNSITGFAVAAITCLIGVVLWIALVTVGRAAMCQLYDQHVSYCPGFHATTTTQEPAR